MKKAYIHPTVINAESLSISGAKDDFGLFPVVEALSAGYAAGRAVKKVFGAAPSIKLPNFKSYLEWSMSI